MEALFMQAFESRDAAEAQMRQQVDVYSRSLSRALVAAGHQPPPCLLPHPAASERRVGAEEQMRQQVASYSQSLACALLAAGHQPPAWLLQPPADVDVPTLGR
jgi:hypothetical protein